MLNKFKGAMIGGLIGDCLGATFEMKYEGMVPLNKVSSFLDSVKRIDMDKVCYNTVEDLLAVIVTHPSVWVSLI